MVVCDGCEIAGCAGETSRANKIRQRNEWANFIRPPKIKGSKHVGFMLFWGFNEKSKRPPWVRANRENWLKRYLQIEKVSGLIDPAQVKQK